MREATAMPSSKLLKERIESIQDSIIYLQMDAKWKLIYCQTVTSV